MAHGEAERSIIQHHLSSGTPFPKWIREAPELLPGLEYFYQCFFEIAGDRPVGMGVGPLPYMLLRTYGIAKGESEDELDDFIYLLREMDREYCAYNQERTEAERSARDTEHRLRSK